MTYLIPKITEVFKYVPATGATITVSPSDAAVLVAMVNNTGLLATLTINMPSGAFDGQLLRVTFNAAVTLITWTGTTLVGTLGGALAGGYAGFVWDMTASVWRRCA